jgi:diguanylate cyclase (GGDEF)-like protein/PAS domain S-box-containing protein
MARRTYGGWLLGERDRDWHAPRPFEGDGAVRRIAPFVAFGLVALAALPVQGVQDPSEAIVGGLAVPVIVATILLVPWRRLPAWCQAIPPLSSLAIIMLLVDANGGEHSVYAAFALLPVFWFALYGTLPQLLTCIGGVALAVGLPVALTGPPDYPATDLVFAGLLAMFGVLIGVTVQRLVRAVRESEAETRSILESAHEAFISIDAGGRIVEWNARAEKEFGWSREEAIGRLLVDTVVPQRFRAQHSAGIARYLETGETKLIGRRLELSALHRDGTEVPVELSISPVHTANGIRFNAFIHGVAERLQAEAALHEAKERFRSAFEDAAIGMALVDEDGVWVEVNNALAEIVGYDVGQLTGKRFKDLTHPEDLPKDLEALEELVNGERDRFQTEKRYVHADGRTVWINLNLSAVRDKSGELLYLIAQMQDVTERKAAQERLAHQASHDSLTGLPNRVLFDDRFALAVSRQRREPAPLALLFLDLDRFKVVNDSIGHDAGDQLLVQAANRLRSLLRPSDTVTRLGGDEFVLLCEKIDEHSAGNLAARVGETISRPFEVGGRNVAVTASIGIAMSRGPDTDPGTLLANADAAMYEAKRLGRSRYVFFAEQMRSRAAGLVEMESDLRAAILAGRLELHYQPEVSLRDGSVLGMEALVRWNHPERGMLAAADFMPIAEESGLVLRIGDWVLNEAARQAAEWKGSGVGPVQIALNLSSKQLADPNLATLLSAAMREWELSPDALCIEVAEGAVVEDPETAFETLQDLKDLDFSIAIDDFGAGGFSLGQLKRLPALDKLKIDGSFVSGLESGHGDAELVSTIVGMAASMGITTIAEHVEVLSQAEQLRGLGCDGAQGYFIARPAPASEAGGLLSAASLGELRI